MKKLSKLSIIPLSLMLLVNPAYADDKPKTNYEEKLPYMFKETTWEKYKNGDRGLWPLPEAPPYSTGLYSMASNNSIDYKEDSNKYYETAAKYKSSGNLEVYYQSNPSTAITTATAEGGKVKKSIGGDTVLEFDFPNTSVSAYNNTKSEHELVLDTSQGQWLVTNGMYSRNNVQMGIRRLAGNEGAAVNTTPLEPNPWGYLGASTFIKPEDFLMGLAKSVYGVQQSRPIYIQTTPNRLAKKVTWFVVNPLNPDGSCGPITWTYQTDQWTNRDVSYINPAWADTSPPACGTSKTIDRGEYIVHPEGYLNNVWYRYYQDQNSFVSANVYELYFLKLLQKGIISIDSSFANITSNDEFVPTASKADNFTFSKDYGTQFYREYRNYGRLITGNSSYDYPVWAPELGALYSNPELTHKEFGSNLTDKNVNITNSGGANKYQRALGINYDIHGSPSLGTTSIRAGTDERPLMAKETVTIINALKLIEKAMRVEHGDMSETEANIITKKYGAQYLDTLSAGDKQTVSYLLAKGVLNFENYQEYSNLYSPLTQSFAYKLLYRVANEEARLKFTEVTLTDSVGLPESYFEYRSSITKANLASLTNTSSILPDGSLKKDNGQPLSLMSDINFHTKFKEIETTADSKVNTIYEIKADIDDALKYLYRGMPLVKVYDDTGNIMKVNGKIQIYQSTKNQLYNDVNEVEKRYVGIKDITFNDNTKRYEVTFNSYGDSYETALQFIKANLETRISNVTTKTEETAIISNTGSPFSSQSQQDLNGSISTNKDITTNKEYDITSYANARGGIAGNTLTEGATTKTVGDERMTSTQHVANINSKTAQEDIGQGGLVSIDASQMKGTPTIVKDTKGKTVGKTDVISEKVSSRPITKGKNDFDEEFKGYNLSMLKSADTLISEQTFNYTDSKGKPATIKGNIVISWRLDLPSEAEQHSLVGLDVSPYINDNTKGSWIFTNPTNKALAEVWNYNVGLNNAILKTVSKNNLNIPSGYFSPQIDLLIDSVNTTTVSSKGTFPQDLTNEQIQEIENNFVKSISENLSSDWVKKYIGDVALANHIVGVKDENIKKYVNKEKSDAKKLRIEPPGKLRPADVPVGKTVWSGLVFGQDSITTTNTDTYFNKHTNRASLTTHTIFNSKDGSKSYGYYSPDEGEGSTEQLTIPFIKDDFKNIFRNIDDSAYSYNEKTKILKESSEFFKPNPVGKTVKYNKEEWIVSDSKPFTLELYSKKFITGMIQNGKIVQSTSGAFSKPEILKVVDELNKRAFGKDQEKGIKSSQYMKTQAFDFIPSSDVVDVGVKFIGIKNGVMSPYIYNSIIDPKNPKKAIIKLEETTLDEGEVVYVPQFVVLSKATWSVNGDKLEWSKKFLGADPELYTRGSLVQSMKEQLLTKSSENLVLSNKVKTGTLDVGSATGKIQGNKVTFTVPFESDMMRGTKLNEAAVLEAFNMNADLTLTNKGETASATQYLENKTVGEYNPNYDLYHNTLVLVKGVLKVATGTETVEYTPSTVVDSVSITSTLMSGVKLLNKGINASFNDYKIHQYQDIQPPALVSPFTNGAPPILNADGSIVPDSAVRHEGLPTAIELFDSMKSQLAEIAAKNAWFVIVIIVVGLGMVLSITTLLAHAFAHSPVSNVFFSKLMDLTGIDFIAVMSIGNVSIEGENKWIRTLITSITLGVIPITVFGLFKVFGLV